MGSHKPEHVDRPHDPSRGFARRHRPLPFRIAHAAEFALCAVLSLGLIEPLLKVSFLQNEMKSMEYAVNDANELLNLPELCEAKDPKTPSSFGLSFEDVSFSYSGDSSDDVLHEVSFDVARAAALRSSAPQGAGKPPSLA